MTVTCRDLRFHTAPLVLLKPDGDGAYACDAAVRRLFDRLVEVGWQSPWAIEFHTYGKGNERWMSWSTIEGKVAGKLFRFWFCRKCGSCSPRGDYNNISALSEFAIPPMVKGEDGYSASIYEDGSGSVTRYTGKHRDWNENFDRVRYARHSNLPKPDWLVINDRLNPMVNYHGETPTTMKAAADGENKMLAQLIRFLEAMLVELAAYPTKPIDINDLFPMPARPLPSPIVVHTTLDHGEVVRIKHVRAGNHDARERIDYGIIPSPRFIYLGVPQSGQPYPKEAHDGHTWARFQPVKEDDRDIRLNHGSVGEHLNHPVAITLNIANDTWVVDMAPYHAAREAGAKVDPTAKYFTNAECDEHRRCAARTMVPIDQYKGDYADPIILIGREIALEDLVIGEPIPSKWHVHRMTKEAEESLPSV